MANAASTIEIELEIRQAINRLDNLQRQLSKSTQSFDKAAQATRKFEGAINKAKAGLVAFFAAISVQKLAQLSDAMTQFENRVKLATNSLVQQLAVQQQLFQVAQKTALPLEDVGQLYSRLRIAAEQLGASQRDLINLTETVGLALKASGTSAASAQGALLQLGQALNSPRVQAEEFNSLIDGMPNLLREVEKQLGLTAGGLKKFVTDGQLSNKKFFDAILASQKALTQQANSSASTIEQANQRVANSFTSLIGAIDDKLGASKFFTGFIDGLASGIDKLSNFLGLTTQATGGGGGGANLDEIISEELEATTPRMPSLYFQTYVEGLAAMMNSNASKTEVKKQIIAFMDYFNQTVEQAVEEGGFSFTPYPDFDPTFKEIIPVKDFIENEYIPILQMLEGMLAAAPNLTFFEEIREELLEQIRLFTVLEENAERTTEAIISGVSGAGPNASRATNIAQSKTIEEAAAKLILSNEKVAAAIDKSFEILFDTLDPFIDILGDLISAINRLIGALIQNATNAAEGLLDTVGLGPNSYIFGGGLARDLEDAFGFGPGSSKATGPTAMQKAFAEADKVFLAIEQEQSTLEKLQPKIDELAALLDSLSLSDIIERFTEQTQKAIEPLQAEIEKYEFALTQTGPGGGANFFADFYNQQIQTATDKIAEVNEKTSIVISGLISEFLSEPLATLDDLERSATDSIAAIEFQNLSAEEQIQFRYDEAIATIEQQKALADLVDDEELRTQLLDSVNRATQAQNDLLAKQQEELQKLNEEREREAELLLQQQGQAQVDKLLSDLERTFDDIIELVQGLRDQASGLLLGQYSTASATDRFSNAADTYSDLLAAALDPEATEENVKDFQDFVDTYLKSAQDVFKSSSRYQNIFNSVLADIEEVAEFVQATMPQSEIDKVREQLTDVAEEFGLGVEEVIEGLDRLVLALTFRALVVDVPVQTVIDEGNSDLIVEAVVTAVEDQQLSDTEIISVVTAVADKLSDTQIEEIVTAVAASGSDTQIESVVTAVAASGSDTIIEKIVTAIAASGSDTQIEAIVSAIAANIPTVTVDVEFNLDPINLAIAELGATLQGAVNNFIVDVNQASGAIEGETLSTLAAFGQGGDILTSGLYAAIKGETTGSTEFVYSPTLGRRIYADTTLAADNREINAESLAASYVDRGIREPSYFIAYQFKDYLGYIDSYLNGFDYKEDASAFYQRILELNNSLQTGQFQNIQKIGFRRGGIVDPMDTIPAMLSPGEYILSPETVRRYGVSNLNRLNAGDTAALNATSDPEVKRLLAELIVAVKENDTEVNVYTDMQGQTKASIEEFRSELRERTRRQGDKFLPARYI